MIYFAPSTVSHANCSYTILEEIIIHPKSKKNMSKINQNSENLWDAVSDTIRSIETSIDIQFLTTDLYDVKYIYLSK